MSDKLQTIPVIPLRGGAVFPDNSTNIGIGRRRSLSAARAAMENNGELLLMVQYDAEVEDPEKDDLIPMAIFATIQDLIRAPQVGVQMLVELHRRVRPIDLDFDNQEFIVGRYEELPEELDAPDLDLTGTAIAYFEEYIDLLGEINQRIVHNLRTYDTPGQLADYITGLLNMPIEMELQLFEEANGHTRLQTLVTHLKQEVRIAELRGQIQQDTRANTDEAQREYFLREQMKVIRKELGEDEIDIIEEFRQKIESAGMPDEVKATAIKELKRLDYQGQQSPESSVIRNYLDWMVDLPWSNETEDNFDIPHVRQVLDEDHYGLEDVKERIVEFVAVRKLAGNKMKGAIINLNGPPGVGKTSIATSVARAIGREMIRISLGGVRDEAEIRGHRRTYIGAMPGRFIRALRDAGTRNPVIVLDEIDKVGSDWRGDPSSALLEVLDPAQNATFADHYLEVPFDLSQVIFITTSNQLGTIPAPLRDRMETIDMSGYIEDEKLGIAEQYLLRKQLEGHGISGMDVTIEQQAFRKIIRHHTREAGVRQLERMIGKVVRKLAVQVASGESDPFKVSEDDIQEMLGPDKFMYGTAEEKDEIGVVTGLAVNAFGGNILSIEVSLSEGNGKITLTGSLGDVMRESAQAALTYARANARTLGLEPSLFDKVNVHIHVPDGATPKDGPSAGISMATAVISAFTRRPVRKDVAMTGEVTLRGKVLRIGGLKSKTIAAHRAGIKTVLLPEENAQDIPDLPEPVRQDLTLIPVSHLNDVLQEALLAGAGQPFTVSEKPVTPNQVSPRA